VVSALFSRVSGERSRTTLPANQVLAKRRTLAPGAREAVQPDARNQNELEVLEDQITICE